MYQTSSNEIFRQQSLFFNLCFKSTLIKGLFIKWPDKFSHFTPKHWEQLLNPGSNAKTLRAIWKSKTISSVSLLMVERSIGMGSHDIFFNLEKVVFPVEDTEFDREPVLDLSSPKLIQFQINLVQDLFSPRSIQFQIYLVLDLFDQS